MIPEVFASLCLCPRCGGPLRFPEGGKGAACSACGVDYSENEGVLNLLGQESLAVSAERQAVVDTEGDASVGGINDIFQDLSLAEGALREAILSLPFGNDSRYYQEDGYFKNVQTHQQSYRFILDSLGDVSGKTLLDIGADLTWSTQLFAKKGAQCVAMDINHHLSVAKIFQEALGIQYGLINADMNQRVFSDESFDIIVAFSALHHSGELQTLAKQLSAMLKLGGQLAFVEPFCLHEHEKEEFGLRQIEEGINENIYLIEEWHQAFAGAGLKVKTFLVNNGFSAVYEKTGVEANAENIFRHYYVSKLAVSESSEAPRKYLVAVENCGIAAWASEGPSPVMLSYHLYQKKGLFRKAELVKFDNPRFPLPRYLGPGESVEVEVALDGLEKRGNYIVEFDLVREGVSWFADKGGETARVEVG